MTATARRNGYHHQQADDWSYPAEAERLLPSELVIDPGLIPSILEIIDPADIHLPAERAIVSAIAELHRAGTPIDGATIGDALHADGHLDDVGGVDGLIDRLTAAPHAGHAAAHAELIREHSDRRRLRLAWQSMGLKLADPAVGLDDLRDAADMLTAHLRRDTRHTERESMSYEELAAAYPRLNPPVIDGLARTAETLNIISVSKVGKSWLVYGLLLSIVTGRDWLGRFATVRGRALLIDNELHRPTLAYRIREVADAMGIPPSDYGDQIDIWPIRGAGLDIFAIGRKLDRIEPGTYRVVVVDAKYRAIQPDASENDNAAETRFYNECDRIAERLQAVLALVHHSSKGSQSDKRVTDVGSGAGAQSRAADAHLVLREHEQAGCVVLDAAVRSFAPVTPIGLRWQFPLWVPDDGIDPTLLKGTQTASEEKAERRDTEADDAVLAACQTWQSRRQIRTETGYSPDRVNRAIARLRKQGLLDEDQQDRPRNPGCEVFRRSIRAHDGGTDDTAD